MGEEKVLAFLKTRGWKILKDFSCDCEVFCTPALIPGYDGEDDLGCNNCAEKCPRCKQVSSCITYSGDDYDKYGETCYGCAVGDNCAVKDYKIYTAEIYLDGVYMTKVEFDANTHAKDAKLKKLAILSYEMDCDEEIDFDKVEVKIL